MVKLLSVVIHNSHKNVTMLCLNSNDLCQAMSAYGYEIVQTLIVDIEPDEHVKRAMNEINAGKTFSISMLC